MDIPYNRGARIYFDDIEINKVYYVKSFGMNDIYREVKILEKNIKSGWSSVITDDIFYGLGPLDEPLEYHQRF